MSQSIARSYLELGYVPIPVPKNSKRPNIEAWQELTSKDAQDLLPEFDRSNIGVLLGKPSGGLTDVDIDCSEIGPFLDLLLPRTMTFGRASKPRSHRIYKCQDAATRHFRDPLSRKMLVEIRSTGAQTVFPGSVHESGEAIEFDTEVCPAVDITVSDLEMAVSRAAAGAILKRHWPEGGRHEAQLALAGALLELKWEPDLALAFLQLVAGEEPKRESTINTTAQKLEAGERVTSWGTLVNSIDKKIVNQAKKWLKAGKETAYDGLALGARNEPIAQASNVLRLLRSLPEWRESIGYNERNGAEVWLKPPPWNGEAKEAQDTDATNLSEWLLNKYKFGIAPGPCEKALAALAYDTHFDRVREYLLGLKWDGKERLDSWLVDMCGAVDTEYTRLVGAKTLISAVARTLDPGCQVDTMLILEGCQGVFKSTLLKTLAGPEYFSDCLPDLETKDAREHVHGPWIIEIKELQVFGRKQVEVIKAFVDERVDRFRPSYGHKVVSKPRRCIFVGTTNADTYLKDATGNRRFWPVKVQECRLERLERDQLWAEAVARYQKKESWWLTREQEKLAAIEQGARFEVDPLEEKIQKVLKEGVLKPIGLQAKSGSAYILEPNPERFRLQDILDALGLDAARLGSNASRYTNILIRLGYTRKKLEIGNLWVRKH